MQESRPSSEYGNDHGPSQRCLGSPPAFSSSRPDGKCLSPPLYNENPNGLGALPHCSSHTPGNSLRRNFDPHYTQSLDTVVVSAVSADGFYSPNPYGVPPANQPLAGKKKSQRASQACDSCRSLKVKCDESKPCQSCKDKKVQCTYRQPEPTAKDMIRTKMASDIETILREVTSLQEILEEGTLAANVRIKKLEERSSKPDRSEATTTQTKNVGMDRESVESDEEMAPPLNPSKPKFGIHHTTGAAELLNWPAIADLVDDEVQNSRINKGKGAKTDRYLWNAEKNRDVRIHGYGEGNEPRNLQEDLSDGHASDSEALSPHMFSEPAYGRVASYPPSQLPPYSTGQKLEKEQNGGLAADGALDLSEATVRKLVCSYMERMNILHPILSPREVKRLVDKFLHEVKSKGSRGSVLGKRSRNILDRKEYKEPSSCSEYARQLPERSPSNAVVLLMLGLGKICEAHQIPEVTCGIDNPTGTRHPRLGRLSEKEQSNISGKPRPIKNLEVIPGMAYVSIATDIIGNQLSGSEIAHIQACILAGLYFGQLVRPIQSHAYLHIASRAIQDQIRLKSSLIRLPKGTIYCYAQDNPIVYAFWTCLQLECDIVTELACVHTGILGYEELMPYPNTTASIEVDGMDPKVAMSYDAQLWLRKHINDIYAHYSPLDPNTTTASFSSIEAAETSRKTQFGHNTIINGSIWPSFTWNFDDNLPDLATDILSARIRAMFYSAQVITYRPFIEAILKHSWNLQHTSGDPSVANINWEYFRRGIRALINNTTAFHGLQSAELIATNIFGIVHAQWGNVLVLLAVYNDPSLREVLINHIGEKDFRSIIKKTIEFLTVVAHSTSGLQIDIRILKAAALKARILSADNLGTSNLSSC